MRTHVLMTVLTCLWTVVGCAETTSSPSLDTLGDVVADTSADSTASVDVDVVMDVDAAAADLQPEVDAVPPGPSFVAVTFNSGTGPEPAHDSGPDDGYSQAMADLTDEWYGNGLNFPPLIEETRAFLASVDPDVVVFQEIFWSGECSGIPVAAHSGLVCEGWSAGDPTVAQTLLGAGYQVACHPGKPDKCAAVHARFGTFAGCDTDFCLEGLAGFKVDSCGSGARVARGVINLTSAAGGGQLTLVNVHGSSGLDPDDFACRVMQVEQIFVDMGDGEPAANGARNLVMGDLNTDPGRLPSCDTSAARWLDFVGDGKDFAWLTEVGEDATPTYAGAVNIDHVASDTFVGSCWAPGVTDGHPAFTKTRFYDHLPAVCDLATP